MARFTREKFHQISRPFTYLNKGFAKDRKYEKLFFCAASLTGDDPFFGWRDPQSVQQNQAWYWVYKSASF